MSGFTSEDALEFNNNAGFKLAATGEWLELNFDTLFYLTANDMLPLVFQDFRGNLDTFGEALRPEFKSYIQQVITKTEPAS